MFYAFVDANIYLDAFKTSDPSFQKHIQVLVERAESVFVTQQVVDEVNRNKLTAAATFVDEQLKKIGLPSVSLPGFSAQLASTLRTLVATTAALKREAEAEASAYFARLAESRDEVSLLLEPLFARAKSPSEEVVQRARLRKERGNPPGKKTDSLGDQISWEQLLEQLRPGDTVLIATHDKDYWLDRRPSPLLFPMLTRDLRVRIEESGEIILCGTLVELVQRLSTLPGKSATVVTSEERARASAVEQALEDDHDDDYDVCEACESDEDHSPHMVRWSIEPTFGRMKTGLCDWCNELSINCVECGFKGPVSEGEVQTCDCEVSVRRVVERNRHGEIERDELVGIEIAD